MMRGAVLAATVLSIGLVTACSSPSTVASPATVTSAPSAEAPRVAAQVKAVQWWTPGDSYCGLLKQTLSAGHSILPGASATDPALHAVTTAFVAELEHVAPAAVAPSWQVLGKLINSLVQANGDPGAVAGVNPAQVRSAVKTVSTDARARCGVNLSAAAH